MRYSKFIIANYRAIEGPLEINIERNRLLPIIGVNESGKTTLLQAIFAFDHVNDKLNDGGRHLRDTSNLYRTSPQPPVISAQIELGISDFVEALTVVEQGTKQKPDISLLKAISRYRRHRHRLPSQILVSRDLTSGEYATAWPWNNHRRLNDLLCRQLLRWLPYILYFDDFRDSVEERIEIVADEDGEPSGWLAIVERLFQTTVPEFSVFKLGGLEERQRKSVLAKVKRRLNATLTKEWQNFRLDDTDALQISVDYERDGVGDAARHFIKLEIIETDANGDEHYFFIRDRSKGFYWFFNFVMKLEFNPKVLAHDDSDTIYLLDEPGSYLHASAQSKLCGKLRQLAAGNRVIYCTHSHYLLDPAVIPLTAVRIADRDGSGRITLTPLHEYPGSILERRSAFQPIIDALEIKPFILDLNAQTVLITEGVCDYYAFDMMKGGRNVAVLPSVGADSVKYYISLMLAWRLDYYALWDNDPAGRRAIDAASEVFGVEIAQRRFRLLPMRGQRSTRILQDLFDSADVRQIRMSLDLPTNAAFDRVIAALYYHADRAEVLSKLSPKTRENFEEVLDGVLGRSLSDTAL